MFVKKTRRNLQRHYATHLRYFIERQSMLMVKIFISVKCSVQNSLNNFHSITGMLEKIFPNFIIDQSFILRKPLFIELFLVNQLRAVKIIINKLLLHIINMKTQVSIKKCLFRVSSLTLLFNLSSSFLCLVCISWWNGGIQRTAWRLTCDFNNYLLSPLCL